MATDFFGNWINPDTGGGFGIGHFKDALGGVGGAVADLFAAEGKKAEAGNYRQAAEFAEENARFAKLSTSIKNMQAERQIYQTIGQQQADVAGAGFGAGGSAGDLLRSSVSQGALTHAVISQQGLIQERGYEEQARSYRAMADAADKASFGDTIGGAIKGVVGVASLFL